MELEDYSTYVIDFEQVNKFSTHSLDAYLNKDSVYPTSLFSITKSFMKMSIRRFENQFSEIYTINQKDNKLFNILHYNKVILSPQDIRNSKIEEIENLD